MVGFPRVYKGANHPAFEGGKPRQGGVMFDTRDLTLGILLQLLEETGMNVPASVRNQRQDNIRIA